MEDLEAAAAEDLEVDEVEEEVSEGEVEEDEDSEVCPFFSVCILKLYLSSLV